MGKIFSHLVIGIPLVLIMVSCATNAPLTFTQLPPVQKSGDDAWNTMLHSISSYYPTIVVANRTTGEIRTAPIVISKCWAGLLYGGNVPCEMERLAVTVSSLSPFKASIAVERHKATAMSNYRTWYIAGNNSAKERWVYDRLVSDLNTPFPSTAGANNAKDTRLSMPSYSVSFNDCGGWKVDRGDTILEKLQLTRTDASVEYKILVLKNSLLDEERQKWDADRIAEDYIEAELTSMKELGQKPGIYRLSGVVKRTEFIGSKKFFVLDYETKNKAGIQISSMYVFLPGSTPKKHFFVAHYSEFAPDGTQVRHAYRHVFLTMLQSLSMSE